MGKISQIGRFNEAVDFNLPGGNNIQMLDALVALQKDIKVLMFSAYEESLYDAI